VDRASGFPGYPPLRSPWPSAGGYWSRANFTSVFFAHVEFVYCSCVRSECNAAALNINAPSIPPPGRSKRSQNPPFSGFRRQLAVVRGSCVFLRAPLAPPHARGGGGIPGGTWNRVIPGPETKTGLTRPPPGFNPDGLRRTRRYRALRRGYHGPTRFKTSRAPKEPLRS
jgi:hypothetical protein